MRAQKIQKKAKSIGFDWQAPEPAAGKVKEELAELLEALIGRAPGAPTIVPASDKRPPLDRVAEAIKDFE